MTIYDILRTNAEIALSGIDVDEFAGKKILVTGAMGLIGINLLTALAKVQKHKKLDVYIEGKGFTHQNAVAVLERGLFLNFNWDHCTNKYDLIIHAAGCASPDIFTKDPRGTVRVNTLDLMGYIAQLRDEDSRMVYLSSAEIYSSTYTGSYIVKENAIGITSLENPREIYCSSKRLGEALCHGDKRVSIARVNMVYGPGGRLGDTRLVNELCQDALKGNLKLRTQGTHRRTFLHVTDATAMILNILLYGKGETFNVAGIYRTSIKDLATVVASLSAQHLYETDKEDTGDSPPNLSIDKYIDAFGGRDFVSLGSGIASVLAWYRELKISQDFREP